MKTSMKKIRLFVDMDGTIVEWKVGNSPEDIFKKKFFFDMNPNKEIICFLKYFLNFDSIEVYILSAYISDHALEEKNQWLDIFMPIAKENRLFVPINVNKEEFVKDYFNREIDSNDILLDDYTPNLIKWEEAGGTAIKALNGINRIEGKWKGLMFDVFDLKFVK